MVWCCRGKKPVHRATLDLIFLKTKEYPPDKVTGRVNLDEQAIEQLRAFAKEKSKTLVDFLENNMRKLKSVGNYLLEKVGKSNNPVDYLLALFVLNNILPAIKNFSYDRGDMVKLIKKVGNNSAAKSTSLQVLLNKHLAENYLNFENRMVEILNLLLSKQPLSPHLSKLVFPHVIETVAIYGNNIPQYDGILSMQSSKQRVIVKILESEKMQPELTNVENIAMQKKIVQGLSGITTNNDRKLSIEVKDDLLAFLFKILQRCQQQGTEGANREKDLSLTDLEQSTLGIIVNIVLNDFHFYDYESGLALVLKKFDSVDWQYTKLQTSFMTQILDRIKFDQYFTTIEGAIVDLLLAILMGNDENHKHGKAEHRRGIVVVDPLTTSNSISNFHLKPNGMPHIISYLKMIMESTKVNMSSFFSVERIVVSLIRKAVLNKEISEDQRNHVLKTLDVILSKLIETSPMVVFYFIESYLREFIIRIEEQPQFSHFFHDLHERFCNTMLKQSNFTRDVTINETLGSLLIHAASLKKSDNLWISGTKLLAIVLNMKRQTESQIEYLRLQQGLILRLLIFIKKSLLNVVNENSTSQINIHHAVHIVSLNFQCLISIILRGSIGDCGLLIAFFRESKRDVVDVCKNPTLHSILKIFWVYSVYLEAKRWEIPKLFDVLKHFTEELSRPETKDILLLLEKPRIEHEKLNKAISILSHSAKAVMPSDISYKSVDKVMREYFEKITLQRHEDIGQSFHIIIQNQQKEKEMIGFIKALMENNDDFDDFDQVPTAMNNPLEMQDINIQLGQQPGQNINYSAYMDNTSLPATYKQDNIEDLINNISASVGRDNHRKEMS
jgi:hypothetical protein